MTKCKECQGKGKWQVRETYSDGDSMLTWYECGSCLGTGIEQDAEAGEDFDIGGDSYANDD